VPDLLTDLADRGIEVVVRGDRLRCSPKAAMTPELTDRLRVYKQDLLAILSNPRECGKCDRCQAALLGIETFDGYTNRFFLRCGAWQSVLGDRPHRAFNLSRHGKRVVRVLGRR